MTYPLETRGEARTTSSAQTGGLDFVNNPIVTLQEDLLCLVPIAHFLSALEVGRVSPIEVLENPVLVLQPTICSYGGGILNSGQASRGASRETDGLSGGCSGRQHGVVAIDWQGGRMTGQELVGECWQDSELELDLIMELPDWLANSLVPILERFTEGQDHI